MKTLLTAALLATATGASAQEYQVAGRTLAPLDTFRDCDICPEMVVLPMGSFLMGSTPEEAAEARRQLLIGRNLDPDPASHTKLVDNFLNETPQHQVVIDIPIAMGLNEVTREEWMACVVDGRCTDKFDDRTRSRHTKGPWQEDPRSPIVSISWAEMQDYVAWLNDKAGANVYRLPTEAEWEYAARAGTDTPFAQGDTLTRTQANFAIIPATMINGLLMLTQDPTNARRPLPVDDLDAANGWGLRHMSGNVAEATLSCVTERQLALGTSTEYLAAATNSADCGRVQKGGNYLIDAQLSRPARRMLGGHNDWNPRAGFRVVRTLTAAP